MVYMQFSRNKRSDFALFNIFPLFVILCDILPHIEIHFRLLPLYKLFGKPVLIVPLPAQKYMTTFTSSI